MGTVSNRKPKSDGIATFAPLNNTSLTQLRNLSTATIISQGNEFDDTYNDTIFTNLFHEHPYLAPRHRRLHSRSHFGEALFLGPASHADIPILTSNNADESGASPSSSSSNISSPSSYSSGSSLNASTYISEFSALFMNSIFEFLYLHSASNSTHPAISTNYFCWSLSRYSTWQWAANGAKE